MSWKVNGIFGEWWKCRELSGNLMGSIWKLNGTCGNTAMNIPKKTLYVSGYQWFFINRQANLIQLRKCVSNHHGGIPKNWDA